MTDIVILNGRVITFDGPDAEALAITGGTITAVGSTADIRALANGARVIDAGGATVLPGFIDSHVHLFGGSAELGYLSLLGVHGVEAIRDAVRPYAASRPDDRLIFATPIDYHAMGGRSITRQDLDAVLPDRPFAAMAADHHTVWANTKAMELAGILHGADLPDGSEIVMAADGTAAGELREPEAFAHVLALTELGGRDLMGFVTGRDPEPAPGPKERAYDKQVLARGLAHCASHGITGLHNMDGNFYQLELLSELDAAGDLIARVEVPMHLKNYDPLDRLAEAEEMRARFATDMVWCNRVKMFMDGVIDSRTACTLIPYPGTDTTGDALFEAAHFAEACRRIDRMGLQISVHAVGDGAVRRVLDGYQAAREANGPRDSRHRVEHIELIHPDDIPRFKALGAVASIQPLHSPRGGLFQPYEPGDLLHPHQFETAFAWRTIRASGAKVIFSTDWPVVPVDVMPTVKGAVHGADLPPHWPDQRQGLRETLASYTCDNAWVEFNERRKGRLKAGMMADIVVMDRDIEAMPTGDLDKARARVTICGGRVTYDA
ncbi:MAG: amidohydrolase [Albidovulum sp.]|uniref:amidohydrolase n=1 Tax=Albidovulum sp. TaxID=1872424 RepID=UPI003C9F7203